MSLPRENQPKSWYAEEQKENRAIMQAFWAESPSVSSQSVFSKSKKHSEKNGRDEMVNSTFGRGSNTAKHLKK